MSGAHAAHASQISERVHTRQVAVDMIWVLTRAMLLENIHQEVCRVGHLRKFVPNSSDKAYGLLQARSANLEANPSDAGDDYLRRPRKRHPSGL